MRLLWAKCVNFTYVWPQSLFSISLCSALLSGFHRAPEHFNTTAYLYIFIYVWHAGMYHSLALCLSLALCSLTGVSPRAHTHAWRTRPYMANPHAYTHTTASSYPYKMLSALSLCLSLSLSHTHTHTYTHAMTHMLHTPTPTIYLSITHYPTHKLFNFPYLVFFFRCCPY